MWFKPLALACVAVPLALSSTAASSAAQRAITDTSRNPHVKLGSVDLDDVRWTDGPDRATFTRLAADLEPINCAVLQPMIEEES